MMGLAEMVDGRERGEKGEEERKGAASSGWGRQGKIFESTSLEYEWFVLLGRRCAFLSLLFDVNYVAEEISKPRDLRAQTRLDQERWLDEE